MLKINFKELQKEVTDNKRFMKGEHLQNHLGKNSNMGKKHRRNK